MVDFITDLTKLWRLGKKVAEGDMTLGDALTGEGGDEPAAEERPAGPPCKKTHGCTEGDGHRGRCCINATPDK